MSIFPRRVSPGDNVIVHIRVNSEAAALSHVTVVQTWIEDPKGRKIAGTINGVFSWPGGGATYNRTLRDVTRKMQTLPPPVLALPLFTEKTKDRMDSVQFFANCAASTHRYLTFRIGKNAPEGKYQVRGNFISAKGSSRSGTLAYDHFFVDRLRVLSTKKTKRGLQVRVQNKSSCPVPAQIIEVDAISGKTHTRPISFRARRTGVIKLRTTGGFIRYASGGKIIGIKADSSPYCIRDPKLDFTDYPRRKTTRVWSEKRKASTLNGAEREIWLAANGVQTRLSIRIAGRRREYDSMLRRGLLREFKSFENLDLPL